MASGRIGLTPDQVEGLAGKIRVVASELAGDDPISDGLGVLQSGAIEDALDAFNRTWSDRRARLIELLSQSQEFLLAAVESFRTADSGLAGALSNPDDVEPEGRGGGSAW